MKWLKIAGVVVLVLWLAWTEWRLERVQNLALQACQAAYMTKAHENLPVCPGVEFVILTPLKNSK